jgi:hypothetical protein
VSSWHTVAVIILPPADTRQQQLQAMLLVAVVVIFAPLLVAWVTRQIKLTTLLEYVAYLAVIWSLTASLLIPVF